MTVKLVYFLFATLLLTPIAANALGIAVTLSSQSVKVGEEVEITISSLTELSYCGVHLYFNGTNEPVTMFRVKHEGVTLPYKFKKAFPSPGIVIIHATGKRVNSAFGCPGEDKKTLTVLANALLDGQALPALPTAATPGYFPGNPRPTAAILVSEAETLFARGNSLAGQSDVSGAFKAFEAAAAKGHAGAMNALGFLLEEGKGVKQDYLAAGSWYQRAMRGGSADAMVNRGLLFSNGLGVPTNKKQAYIHFALGAIFAREDGLRVEASNFRDQAKQSLSATDTQEGDREVSRMVREEIK